MKGLTVLILVGLGYRLAISGLEQVSEPTRGNLGDLVILCSGLAGDLFLLSP